MWLSGGRAHPPMHTDARSHSDKRENEAPSPWVQASPQSYKHQYLFHLRTTVLKSCPSLAQTRAEGKGARNWEQGEGPGEF